MQARERPFACKEADTSRRCRGASAPARGNACQRLATASPDLRSGTATALSNFGDLWFLGRHRVLCGNALERSDFETLMGGERAAVTFTDPPGRAPRLHQLERSGRSGPHVRRLV